MGVVDTQIFPDQRAREAPFDQSAEVPATTTQGAIEYLRSLISSLSSALKAPQYIVAASSSDLDNERVATNTASIEWDFATAAQAKANAVAASETVSGISERATTDEAVAGVDTVRHVVPAGLKAHVDAVAATLQPLDSDLTAIAALSTTAYGRALLTLANATALAAEVDAFFLTPSEGNAAYQPLDSDLTAIAALSPSNDDIVQRKAGAWTNRSMAQLIADLAALGTTFQPLDSDLTAIAALTTTAYGRALLELANATALTALLNAFTGDSGAGGVKGLVPAPAAGDAAANKVLAADGTWVAQSGGGSSGLPPGYLFGLTLSNNASDATNDIDIAAGRCRDSTNAVDIIFSSAVGKRLDANWATGGTPGSTVGGRNSGAAITNGTYHVYAVAKAAGADPEIYIHASATIATVITALQAETGGASYLYARRIGSIVRVSAAIKAFKQCGDVFDFDVQTAVLALTGSLGTSAVTRTATDVPTGIQVHARLNVALRNAGVNLTSYVLVTSLDQTDTAASASAFTQAATAPGGSVQGMASTEVLIFTDTSGQFRTRNSDNSASIQMLITCRGWTDRRGRDD
jgi:hypothetical protein